MELTVKNIDLIIEGEWEGEYHSRTHDYPGEQPEFGIHSVYLKDSDEDIFEILSESFIAEIYDKIYSN
jgi:hypothetical protein